MTGYKTNSGERLRRLWKIPVQQARFHKGGTFFMPLEHFPGALCDPDGYVIFDSKEQYESCSALEIGKRVNVRNGISKIRGYRCPVAIRH